MSEMNIDAEKFQTLDLVRCQLHFEFHRTFHPGVSVFFAGKSRSCDTKCGAEWALQENGKVKKIQSEISDGSHF